MVHNRPCRIVSTPALVQTGDGCHIESTAVRVIGGHSGGPLLMG